MGMQLNASVGVFVTDNQDADYTWFVPEHSIFLCEEHQEEKIAGYPYTFRLPALLALYADAHCRICGKSLAWPARSQWQDYIWQIGYQGTLFYGPLASVEEREAGKVFLTITTGDPRRGLVITLTAPLTSFQPFVRRDSELWLMRDPYRQESVNEADA